MWRMEFNFFGWQTLDYHAVRYGDGWRDKSPYVAIKLEEYMERAHGCSAEKLCFCGQLRHARRVQLNRRRYIQEGEFRGVSWGETVKLLPSIYPDDGRDAPDAPPVKGGKCGTHGEVA